MRNVVGGVLRSARRRRGLTLRDVEVRSGGRFKQSAIGGYERGERAISLERFCDLAAIYAAPPDRLLDEILSELAADGRTEVAIDLNRLSLLEKREGRAVAEFVYRIKAQRGDYLTDTITLRSGDVEALALDQDLRPDALMRRLVPALKNST